MTSNKEIKRCSTNLGVLAKIWSTNEDVKFMEIFYKSRGSGESWSTNEGVYL